MADFYTEVSTTLDQLTPEEAAWLARQVDTKRLARAVKREPKHSRLVLYQQWAEFESLGFVADFESEPDGKQRLWIHHDESAEVDPICDLIRGFLRRFRPGETYLLEWANTASRPVAGELGGGWVIITPTDVYSDWRFQLQAEKMLKSKAGEEVLREFLAWKEPGECP